MNAHKEWIWADQANDDLDRKWLPHISSQQGIKLGVKIDRYLPLKHHIISYVDRQCQEHRAERIQQQEECILLSRLNRLFVVRDGNEQSRRCEEGNAELTDEEFAEEGVAAFNLVVEV